MYGMASRKKIPGKEKIFLDGLAWGSKLNLPLLCISDLISPISMLDSGHRSRDCPELWVIAVQKTKSTEAIISWYEDNILSGQNWSIIVIVEYGSKEKSAAIYPEHDRL